MKALVTGAAGFIGSHLAEALVGRGYEVTCLARKTSNLKWIEHLDLKYLLCDLADIESCPEKISGFDFVFHAAGITKTACEKDFFTVNAECTRKLLRVVAASNPGLKRFIYVSTLAAAGPGRDGKPVDEETSASPVSSYGKSKLEGERAVLEYGTRIPVTIVRPSAVYGPRDTDFFLLFSSVKKGFYPYWGRCYYSLIYVEDLVRGIIVSAEKKEGEGRTFFLADETVYTNDDILQAISAALGRRAVRVRLPRRLMPLVAYIGEKIDKKGIINRDKAREARYSNWTCDVGRAREELGFKAKTTLREGTKWTADWYRIHRWL
jgi:nucleoside-diphosphate-sugar epimerase